MNRHEPYVLWWAVAMLLAVGSIPVMLAALAIGVFFDEATGWAVLGWAAAIAISSTVPFFVYMWKA